MPSESKQKDEKEKKMTGQGTCIAEELVERSNAAFSSDDEALLEAANTTFNTKISFRKRLFIGIAIVCAFFISFSLGKYSVNPVDLMHSLGVAFVQFGLTNMVHMLEAWQSLTGAEPVIDPQSLLQVKAELESTLDPKLELVLYNIRFPRILVVMLVGAALSTAGASYQGMFKNPLTSPDLLGASAGASLGACIALLMNQGGVVVQISAFAGGMIAVGIAVGLNRFVNYEPTLGLILAGILVGSLFNAGMSLVKYVADANDQLPAITFWLMGSFAAIDTDALLRCLIPLIIGFVILLSQSWKLNVLSFGDEEARTLGINTGRTRLLVILGATLLTSISVAMAGIVGWVGLVIPHLARAIVGPNYRVLLPTSIFIGAVYLLIVDNFARLLTTVEIPIGILTAIMGVPFFVFIFKRNMKGWK